MKLISILLLLTVLPFSNISSQFWTEVEKSSLEARGKRDIVPTSYILAKVDDSELRKVLWQAPLESESNVANSNTLLPVMLRDGRIVDFRIVEYKMMEPELAASYPNIKTFIGHQADDPVKKLRLDYTVHGIRAVINDRGKRTYIDHYQRNDKAHKIIYQKHELENTKHWSCGVEGNHPKEGKTNNSERQGDCQLRNYELSVTATGEYSNFHDAYSVADSALVQSAVTTTVNRVNDVYEIDLAVRFILIDNNDDIYYYDPDTDPFTANNTGANLDENQTNTDNVIGDANYDIGHIFSTGDGGVAQLNSLCNDDGGGKARGATALGSPVEDPFDIDYVAHEIGHQMGGNHTQNNNCNRSNAHAVEPGSAATIMGYAGICAPNVQNNSDAYFHAESIEEMMDQVIFENNNNSGCQEIIAWANTAPTVNDIDDKTIPGATPFILETTGSDPNADSLTYNWEQMDTEVATMPPVSTNTGGPTFRSLFATPEPYRYFPSIDDILDGSNGSNDDWETLPSVDRTMNFRVTVRDFHNDEGGCTDEQDVIITVDGDSGPFKVNTANTASAYIETETITVEWDVAGTDVAPVSCSEVDILFSYDGGDSFNTILLANAANDGIADVTFPIGLTTTGRIMVKCSDNYFFDINDADITINQGSPTYALSTNPPSEEICIGSSSFVINLESESILGFDDPIALQVTNLPGSATASIANNPLVPGASTTITISNLSGLSGLYTIAIGGVANGIMKSTTFDIQLLNAPNTPVQTSPTDNAMSVSLTPTLTWGAATDATSYTYKLGTSAGASDVETGTVTGLSVDVSATLSTSTTYYWSVKSINGCDESAYSEDFAFTTKTCKTFYSSNVPLSISSSGTPTIISNLNIRDRGVINDLNVIDLEGTHTWMEDLNFTLIAPDETEVNLFDDNCGQLNDFDINFDDEADDSDWPCPPTDGLTYIPEVALSAFDGKDMKGNWVMEVFDDVNQDGGSLDTWAIEYCTDDYCDLTVDSDLPSGAGTLKNAIDCATDGDTIFLESIIPSNTIDLGNLTLEISESITIFSEGDFTVLSTNPSAVFLVENGPEVSFNGFNIQNTVGDGILNFADLTLTNVNITTTSNNHVVNQITGTLNLNGNCNMQIE